MQVKSRVRDRLGLEQLIDMLSAEEDFHLEQDGSLESDIELAHHQSGRTVNIIVLQSLTFLEQEVARIEAIFRKGRKVLLLVQTGEEDEFRIQASLIKEFKGMDIVFFQNYYEASQVVVQAKRHMQMSAGKKDQVVMRKKLSLWHSLLEKYRQRFPSQSYLSNQLLHTGFPLRELALHPDNTFSTHYDIPPHFLRFVKSFLKSESAL